MYIAHRETRHADREIRFAIAKPRSTREGANPGARPLRAGVGTAPVRTDAVTATAMATRLDASSSAAAASDRGDQPSTPRRRTGRYTPRDAAEPTASTPGAQDAASGVTGPRSTPEPRPSPARSTPATSCPQPPTRQPRSRTPRPVLREPRERLPELDAHTCIDDAGPCPECTQGGCARRWSTPTETGQMLSSIAFRVVNRSGIRFQTREITNAASGALRPAAIRERPEEYDQTLSPAKKMPGTPRTSLHSQSSFIPVMKNRRSLLRSRAFVRRRTPLWPPTSISTPRRNSTHAGRKTGQIATASTPSCWTLIRENRPRLRVHPVRPQEESTMQRYGP